MTADLMERFYAELEAGKPVPAALRSAQLEIRSKRPHPFYWAGFIAIGDGDVTVRLARQPPGRRYLLILAGLTVVGVAAWVIMRGRGTIEA